MNWKVSFRPLFTAFVGLSIGVYFVGELFNLNYIYSVISIIVLFAIIIFSLSSFVYYSFAKTHPLLEKLNIKVDKTALEKVKYGNVLSRKDVIHKKKREQIYRIVILTIFFFLGAMTSVLYAVNFNTEKFNDGLYFISARISSIDNSKDTTKIILENVEIIDENAIKVKYNKKLLCLADLKYSNIEFKIGDICRFNSYISPLSAFQTDYVNTSVFKKKTPYLVRMNPSEVVVQNGKLKPDEFIRNRVKICLEKYLDKENANIAYAMLFGDKSNLDDEIYSSFTGSGVAHILAVSGLHVAFLTTLILYFFINILKCKKRNALIILFFILFGYAYLCEFSVSVLRGVLMGLLLFWGQQIEGQEVDILSSSSLAGILISLFIPFSIFDVGFQLSFACILGLAFFKPKLKQKLLSLNFNMILAENLSSAFAIQFAIIPIILNVFSHVSLLSIFANFLVIPFMSLLFPLILIFVFLGAIYTPLGCLLVGVNYLLLFIVGVSNFTNNLNFGLDYTHKFGSYFVWIIGLIYFLCSGIVNLKISSRIFLVSMLICCCFTVAIYEDMHFNPIQTEYSTISTVGNIRLIREGERSIFINIGSKGNRFEREYISEFLHRNHTKYVDSLFLIFYNSKLEDNLKFMIKEFGVQDVYVSSFVEKENLKDKFNVNVVVLSEEDKVKIQDKTFSFVFSKSSCQGLKIIDREKKIFIFKEDMNMTLSDYLFMKLSLETWDYVFVDKVNGLRWTDDLKFKNVYYSKLVNSRNIPVDVNMINLGKHKYSKVVM